MVEFKYSYYTIIELENRNTLTGLGYEDVYKRQALERAETAEGGSSSAGDTAGSSLWNQPVGASGYYQMPTLIRGFV